MSDDNIVNYPSRSGKSTQRGIQNRDVNAAQRARQALQLRAQMLTYEEIASRCGYATRDAARKAILRELDRVVVKDVQTLRDQELHMLNIMHQEVWLLFMDKKNRGRLFAADRLLEISKDRRKLMGLDVKVDDAPGPQIIIQEVPLNYLEGPKE